MQVHEMILQLRNELQIPSNVKIETQWVSPMFCYNIFENSSYDGECESITPTHFIIRLNTRLMFGSYHLYSVVAHEMRHVWQIMNRYLEIPTDKTFYWCNKRHYFCKYPYDDRPYEKDAFGFSRVWAYNNHPRYAKCKRLIYEDVLTAIEK
jgi:hypothetical protein